MFWPRLEPLRSAVNNASLLATDVIHPWLWVHLNKKTVEGLTTWSIFVSMNSFNCSCHFKTKCILADITQSQLAKVNVRKGAYLWCYVFFWSALWGCKAEVSCPARSSTYAYLHTITLHLCRQPHYHTTQTCIGHQHLLKFVISSICFITSQCHPLIPPHNAAQSPSSWASRNPKRALPQK